ncbi:MAG: undecaprenyldiphospho-muramoylpentapeptide beta-N-acetylglucosaminyltransferase [Spirochaetales bacterium]|nr:undecaprenyldiphospho-muramoylpentapeptide beta-N-acetylglucosaminyltransferase [Spirochaetales bacterium]
MKRVFFTGGGTAGHVFPGLAVARLLKKKWPCSLYWIGKGYGMERSLVHSAGIRFLAIPAGKLRRYFSVWNVVDIFAFLGGIFYSFVYLLVKRPALVFSKGGFVSVPPLIAAKILRIPSITHESDFDPGLATKINARFADRVLTSFDQSLRFFPGSIKHKIVCSGNPVRSEILKGDARLGKSITGCPPEKKLILVIGGSQGSRHINRYISLIIEELVKKCFVVHQTGEKNNRQHRHLKHYYTSPFFKDELPHILAAADLVISRAGANTLWELAATGTPSILIPLGTKSSRGDQLRNANIFKNAGASLVIAEESVTAGNLLETIFYLLDNKSALIKMSKSAHDIGRPQASENIVKIILETVGKKK